MNFVNALAFRELLIAEKSSEKVTQKTSILFCLGYMSDKTITEITQEKDHWFKKLFLAAVTNLAEKHISDFKTQDQGDIMALLKNLPKATSLVSESEDQVRLKMRELHEIFFDSKIIRSIDGVRGANGRRKVVMSPLHKPITPDPSETKIEAPDEREEERSASTEDLPSSESIISDEPEAARRESNEVTRPQDDKKTPSSRQLEEYQETPKSLCKNPCCSVS